MNVLVLQTLLLGVLTYPSQAKLEGTKLYSKAIEISVYSCQKECDIETKPDRDLETRCSDIYRSYLNKKAPYNEIHSTAENNFLVCQSKIRATLLGNEVLLSVNGRCNCSGGYCVDDINNHVILWSTPESCDLTSICNNYTITANKTENILDATNSIQPLTQLCSALTHPKMFVIFKEPEEVKQKIIVNTQSQAMQKNVDEAEKILESASAEIHRLKLLNYSLVIVVTVFVLCYVLNLVVNFCTLRTAGKKLSKSKAYLLNCVSQSLTNRYIFLNSTDDGTYASVTMSKLEKSMNLYECVDEK